MAEPTTPGAAPGGPAPAPDGVPPGPSVGASAGSPGTARAAAPPPRPPADDPVTQLIDAGADLLTTTRDYVRQEAEGITREKIAKPLQDAGVVVGEMSAAAMLLVLGIIFIAVAGIIWLSFLVGPALAFLIIGAVLLAGSAVFLFMKSRQIQKNAEALERSQALRSAGKPAPPAPAPARRTP